MSGVAIGIGLGSNIGDKAEHIAAACETLTREAVIRDLVLSSLYRTAPWGHVQDQDWFVNACAVGTTELPPAELLVRFKSIERRLGRRDTTRWGPRVIDVDLLFYGDLTLASPGLTIPHKEILRRAFVLVPLAEIAPDRCIGGITVAAAAAAIAQDGIEKLPTGCSG